MTIKTALNLRRINLLLLPGEWNDLGDSLYKHNSY